MAARRGPGLVRSPAPETPHRHASRCGRRARLAACVLTVIAFAPAVWGAEMEAIPAAARSRVPGLPKRVVPPIERRLLASIERQAPSSMDLLVRAVHVN